MQAASLFLCFWQHFVATRAFLKCVHAVSAAKDDRALVCENPVDHPAGLSIHRTEIIDGQAAFGEDSRHADERKEKGWKKCFHGGLEVDF